MNKRLISQILASIVIFGSLIVMAGWIFDVAVFKSILPGWVSMKFITALSFFFTGVLLLMLSKKDKNERCKFFIMIISFALLLLMISFLSSLFLNISIGIENLFVKEAPGAVLTKVPGLPAVPTMICFILISLSGLIFVYNPESLKSSFWLGIGITILAGIAIAGYILNVPLLYYSFNGLTPMAFHTSILFVLMGISSILIGFKELKK